MSSTSIALLLKSSIDFYEYNIEEKYECKNLPGRPLKALKQRQVSSTNVALPVIALAVLHFSFTMVMGSLPN